MSLTAIKSLIIRLFVNHFYKDVKNDSPSQIFFSVSKSCAVQAGEAALLLVGMEPGVMDDVIDVLLREDECETARKLADIPVDEAVHVVSEETVDCAEAGALDIHSFSENYVIIMRYLRVSDIIPSIILYRGLQKKLPDFLK